MSLILYSTFLLLKCQLFLPVQQYASSVLAVGLCLSQVGVLLKPLNGSRWFLEWEFHLSYRTYIVL